jgi:hypothetical protein
MQEPLSSRWPFGDEAEWDLPKRHMAPNYTPPAERWEAWRRGAAGGRAGSATAAPPGQRLPSSGSVETLPPGSEAEAVLDLLVRDGAVILSAQLTDELRRAVAAATPSPDLVASLGPAEATGLLAEETVCAVCEAVLGGQVLRGGPEDFQQRVVLPGNFTNNVSIASLPWELDYCGPAADAQEPPNRPPPAPFLTALDSKVTVVWKLGGDQPLAGWLHGTAGAKVAVELAAPGDVLGAVGGGPARWTAAAAEDGASDILAVGYQLGVFMPAENFYLKHDPLQVLDYPVPLQRLLGFHLPGAVLNKFYSGPGEHDVLLASSNLRGRRIDWASIGQPAPPTPDGVTYLPLMEPAEGSVVTPRVLPPSIAAATASLEGLYAEYNSEAGGHCRTKLHAALSAAAPTPVTVTWDVNSPLVDTVGELLAAVDRDGVAILSGAVSHAGENQRSLFLNLARLNTDDLPREARDLCKENSKKGAFATVCDQIQRELRRYTYTTGPDVENQIGSVGCVLSRSPTAASEMACHPAVLGIVEAVLGANSDSFPASLFAFVPSLSWEIMIVFDWKIKRGGLVCFAGRQLLHDGGTSGSSRLPWRLHVHETIPKPSGDEAQQLHRDGDLSLLEFNNELEHAIGLIWALGDSH